MSGNHITLILHHCVCSMQIPCITVLPDTGAVMPQWQRWWAYTHVTLWDLYEVAVASKKATNRYTCCSNVLENSPILQVGTCEP